MRRLGQLFVLTASALSVSGLASADEGRHDRERDDDESRPTVAAPEIDPASAMSALTLLAGSMVVLRGRRRRD